MEARLQAEILYITRAISQYRSYGLWTLHPSTFISSSFQYSASALCHLIIWPFHHLRVSILSIHFFRSLRLFICLCPSPGPRMRRRKSWLLQQCYQNYYWKRIHKIVGYICGYMEAFFIDYYLITDGVNFDFYYLLLLLPSSRSSSSLLFLTLVLLLLLCIIVVVNISTVIMSVYGIELIGNWWSLTRWCSVLWYFKLDLNLLRCQDVQPNDALVSKNSICTPIIIKSATRLALEVISCNWCKC